MAMARPYPIFLDLKQRPVLVVGGGTVALRKIRGLLEAGARVTVIATELRPELAKLKLQKIRQPYASAHMRAQPWQLVFAATDSPDENARIYRDALQRRILCCRCDESDGSDFAGAAVAYAGPVTLAVSSAGASPALAARIRDQAAAAIDPVLARLAELLPTWRAHAKKSIAHPQLRRKLLQQLAGPIMEETFRKHGPRQARSLFTRWLREAREDEET